MNNRDQQRQSYLNAMGIVVWKPRLAATTALTHIIDEPPPIIESQTTTSTVNNQNWEQLTQNIQNCKACQLYRDQIPCILGSGNRSAKWLIISDSIAIHEDQEIIGFLNQILQAISLRPEDRYISNIVKSIPATNRSPQLAEINLCAPHLTQEIELIRPDLILVMGELAAQYLLTINAPISTMRGKIHYYGKKRIPLVVTYHPRYLLNTPQGKSKTWDDLRLAWRIYKRVPPEGLDL